MNLSGEISGWMPKQTDNEKSGKIDGRPQRFQLVFTSPKTKEKESSDDQKKKKERKDEEEGDQNIR